ncbi:hypothetical protein PCL_01034 [Purpureocillium lilacinum]|uniref:F-box domain-containing protein n=2 Tax=Purpureocillium lilacinum TaxID=33203 RepID=A0A2U3E4G9_PURLI|nr:hypothetical protein PCL_01034 [Purpureocillium lilacinum]
MCPSPRERLVTKRSNHDGFSTVHDEARAVNFHCSNLKFLCLLSGLRGGKPGPTQHCNSTTALSLYPSARDSVRFTLRRSNHDAVSDALLSVLWRTSAEAPNAGSMAIPSSASIEKLPAELLLLITNELSNRELKNLRLTSRFFSTVSLRIHRVFLSPNPRNVDVFLAIANHDAYRSKVVEIIYDDARLPRSAAEAGSASDPGYYHGWDLPTAEEDNLTWFAKCCEENIFTLNGRRGQDVARPDHTARLRQCDAEMPLIELWSYYQQLVRQQDEILQSGADIAALAYALSRFPSLRRVTITPAAHGFLFNPLYAAPMIREFPVGFNYPIPRGWPTPEYTEASEVEALPWVEAGPSSGFDFAKERAKWRGFSEVTRVLSEQQQSHNVVELIVDAHTVPTGLNCRVFEQWCEDYSHLVSIIRRPGFSCLSLSLLVGGQKSLNWPAFRSGLLRDALMGATDLKSLTLATNLESDPWLDDEVELLPLHTIFPIGHLSRLEHFGLWNFLVQQSDLMRLLAALTGTIRSVELEFLHFLHERGNHHDLLEDMRETLGWQSRENPPKVRIATYDMSGLPVLARAHWLESEITDFLYGWGENPFSRNADSADTVRLGYGTLRDVFEPAYERPWVSPEEYRRLGIHRGLHDYPAPDFPRSDISFAAESPAQFQPSAEGSYDTTQSTQVLSVSTSVFAVLILGCLLAHWLG